MQTDMRNKYVIVKGLKIIGTLFFDTEQEANDYIQDTKVRPSDFSVKMYEEFIY